MEKILLIDDAKDMHELINSYLRKDKERQVVHAFDGAQAMQVLGMKSKTVAADDIPDLILLDIEMPGANGIEVCKAIRQKDEYKKTPIIFMTAYTDIESHTHALEAGATGYMTKPLQRQLVIATINNAIKMKKLSDAVDALIVHKTSLTNMLVHDINNQLSTIMLTLGLGFDVNNPEKINERAKRIEKNVLEIKKMTSDLLAVEKLESKTFPMKQDLFNAWDLLAERAGVVLESAEERKIQIIKKAPATPAIITGDPEVVARVFDNLLQNAVKFTPEAKTITITANLSKEHWVFVIENEGPAIEQRFHKKIFEKFGQAECRTAMTSRGVGLGLAFCKLALEAMSGTIGVQSPVRCTDGGEASGVRMMVSLLAAE